MCILGAGIQIACQSSAWIGVNLHFWSRGVETRAQQRTLAIYRDLALKCSLQ